MSTSLRVSRGFHRLTLFLAALLVVGTVLCGPAQASLTNSIAQTPVGVRPEAPYAWAVKGTQYARNKKEQIEYKHGVRTAAQFRSPP